MIKTGQHTTHISFEWENAEEFFLLGYKVLQKQPMPNTIKGLKVKYNGNEKLLYSVENLSPIANVIPTLSETERVKLITDFLKTIQRTTENGFLPKEAIVVNKECLFWDKEKKSIQVIVLPINHEPNLGDSLSWVMRLRESLLYIGEYLNEISRGRLKCYFESIEAVPTELDAIIRELEDMGQSTGNVLEGHYAQKQSIQMELHGLNRNRNVCIIVNKNDFVLGKKRENVDGYIDFSDHISRMHCKILCHENEYYCMDLGSLNHTYLNGKVLTSGEKYEIQNNDILKLADVEFRIHI